MSEPLTGAEWDRRIILEAESPACRAAFAAGVWGDGGDAEYMAERRKIVARVLAERDPNYGGPQ